MKYRKTRLVLIGLVIGAVAVFGYYRYQVYMGQQAVAATKLESVPLAEALVKARATSRLVLVAVSAIWCATCHELDATVLADPRVNSYIRDQLVFSRLEQGTKEGQAFLRARNTTGFPNLWLVDGEGKPVRQISITFDPLEFLAQLSQRT